MGRNAYLKKVENRWNSIKCSFLLEPASKWWWNMGLNHLGLVRARLLGVSQLHLGYSTVWTDPGAVLVGWDVVKYLPENRKIWVKWCLQRRPLLVGVSKTSSKSSSKSVYCIGNTLQNRSILGQIHPGFATRGFDPSVRLETSTEQKPSSRRGRPPSSKRFGALQP